MLSPARVEGAARRLLAKEFGEPCGLLYAELLLDLEDWRELLPSGAADEAAKEARAAALGERFWPA